MEESCLNCSNHAEIPGSCHIQCSKPPKVIISVKRIDDNIRNQCKKAIEDFKKQEKSAVIRCRWPGSGIFPFAYDPNTIIACTNFHPGKPKQKPAYPLAVFLIHRYKLWR